MSAFPPGYGIDPTTGQLVPAGGYNLSPLPTQKSTAGAPVSSVGGAAPLGPVNSAFQAGPGKQLSGVDPFTGLPTYTNQPGVDPNATAYPTTTNNQAGSSQSSSSGAQSGSTASQGQTDRTGSPLAEAALAALTPKLGAEADQAAVGAQGATNLANQALAPSIDTPGYNPAELSQIQVGPEERNAAIDLAEAPVTGSANAARDQLKLAAAARGGYAPGLNATLEQIQQQEGAAGSQAALTAGLSEDQAARAAAEAAANARIQDQQFGASGATTLAQQAQTNQLGLNTQASNIALNNPDSHTTDATSGTQQSNSQSNSTGSNATTSVASEAAPATVGGGGTVGANTTGKPITAGSLTPGLTPPTLAATPAPTATATTPAAPAPAAAPASSFPGSTAIPGVSVHGSTAGTAQPAQLAVGPAQSTAQSIAGGGLSSFPSSAPSSTAQTSFTPAPLGTAAMPGQQKKVAQKGSAF